MARQDYAATTELNAEILRHILDLHTASQFEGQKDTATRSITPKLIKLSDAEFMESYARPVPGKAAMPSGSTHGRNGNNNNSVGLVPRHGKDISLYSLQPGDTLPKHKHSRQFGSKPLIHSVMPQNANMLPTRLSVGSLGLRNHKQSTESSRVPTQQPVSSKQANMAEELASQAKSNDYIVPSESEYVTVFSVS